MTTWTPRNFERGPLRHWLQATGSLSARLAASGEVFSVQVLRQGREALAADEAQALRMADRRIGYVREVLLRVDGVAMVFARSVTRHTDSLGAWRAVRGLGARPLADVLFTRSGITRQPLNYRQFAQHTAPHRRVVQHWQAAHTQPGEPRDLPRSLPARRSVFDRQGAHLLVMEVFIAPRTAWLAPCKLTSPIHKRTTS